MGLELMLKTCNGFNNDQYEVDIFDSSIEALKGEYDISNPILSTLTKRSPWKLFK